VLPVLADMEPRSYAGWDRSVLGEGLTYFHGSVITSYERKGAGKPALTLADLSSWAPAKLPTFHNWRTTVQARNTHIMGTRITWARRRISHTKLFLLLLSDSGDTKNPELSPSRPANINTRQRANVLSTERGGKESLIHVQKRISMHFMKTS